MGDGLSLQAAASVQARLAVAEVLDPGARLVRGGRSRPAGPSGRWRPAPALARQPGFGVVDRRVRVARSAAQRPGTDRSRPSPRSGRARSRTPARILTPQAPRFEPEVVHQSRQGQRLQAGHGVIFHEAKAHRSVPFRLRCGPLGVSRSVNPWVVRRVPCEGPRPRPSAGTGLPTGRGANYNPARECRQTDRAIRAEGATPGPLDLLGIIRRSRTPAHPRSPIATRDGVSATGPDRASVFGRRSGRAPAWMIHFEELQVVARQVEQRDGPGGRTVQGPGVDPSGRPFAAVVAGMRMAREQVIGPISCELAAATGLESPCVTAIRFPSSSTTPLRPRQTPPDVGHRPGQVRLVEVVIAEDEMARRPGASINHLGNVWSIRTQWIQRPRPLSATNRTNRRLGPGHLIDECPTRSLPSVSRMPKIKGRKNSVTGRIRDKKRDKSYPQMTQMNVD